MKQRTKRDMLIFLGVVVLLGGIAFANAQLRRGDLAGQFERLREGLEANRMGAEGINLLQWNLVRKTTGSLRKGGNYAEELLAYNGQPVHMIGFMVPQEQFRDVTEFMILPIPIECYFCAMPPSRDVLFVKLQEGETQQIYTEPVLILGNFTVHEGPEQKFFYSLQDATIAAAEDGGELTRRRLRIQHMLPNHERDPAMLLDPVKDRDRTD